MLALQFAMHGSPVRLLDAPMAALTPTAGVMKPGSAIINTASVTSDMPNQTLLAYSTTKGAIQNFTGGLAQMLAEKGVRVNAVAPGPIWTPLIPSTMPEETASNHGKHVPIQTSWPAGGTGHGLRDAGRSSIQLYVRNDGGGHRRKAIHLGPALARNEPLVEVVVDADKEGTDCPGVSTN